MYSVSADILGELKGRDELVEVTEPFCDGMDVFDDIFARLRRLMWPKGTVFQVFGGIDGDLRC